MFHGTSGRNPDVVWVSLPVCQTCDPLGSVLFVNGATCRDVDTEVEGSMKQALERFHVQVMMVPVFHVSFCTSVVFSGFSG